MPDLSFEVTPPRPGIDLATLSPRSFIEHPKMLSPFKRKSSLLLTASDQKKLRLDPSICPDDSTIMDYFNRTHNLLSKDREKLIINLPFTAPLNRIKEDLKVRKSEYRNILD